MRDNMIYRKKDSLQCYMGYMYIREGETVHKVKVYALSTIQNFFYAESSVEMLMNLNIPLKEYLSIKDFRNITDNSEYKKEVYDVFTFCGYPLNKEESKKYNTEWSIPSNCIISATLIGYESGDEATANPYTKRLFLS